MKQKLMEIPWKFVENVHKVKEGWTDELTANLARINVQPTIQFCVDNFQS